MDTVHTKKYIDLCASSIDGILYDWLSRDQHNNKTTLNFFKYHQKRKKRKKNTIFNLHYVRFN
ncbi:MAG: hypothetical protein P8M29_11895, partial [Tateyamaria sp.]|nr:hypothetical protein [Tateyamaria sp.]